MLQALRWRPAARIGVAGTAADPNQDRPFFCRPTSPAHPVMVADASARLSCPATELRLNSVDKRDDGTRRKLLPAGCSTHDTAGRLWNNEKRDDTS